MTAMGLLRRACCGPVLIGASVWATPAVEAEQGLALMLNGTGPYYTLHLPMAVQSQAGTVGLSDLQVQNARGEALSFAWVDPMPAASQQQRQGVALFKLPGAASGATIGPSRGWMFDLRSVPGHLLKLELGLPAAARGVYSLAVEASPDLQQWQLVQAAAQVLSLEHQGQRLLSTDIDLHGVRASYLRVTALRGSPVPDLESATVTSVTQPLAPQAMQWSEPIAPSRCEAQHCDYAMPRNVPLEQLQITLAERNTVANVELLGEAQAAWPQPERHHLPHPLKALRHKSEPASMPSAAPVWMPLASTNVYWLTRPPEGELRSGPVWLNGSVTPTLRLSTQGPLSQLGPTPPTVRIGTHTRSLVFLARGPAPYRLVWGGTAPALPRPMPLTQLMPARQAADALPQDIAMVVLPPASAAAMAAAPSSPASAAVAAPSSHRAPWLWAVLLAGLALMGAMAWMLLRRPPAPADS